MNGKGSALVIVLLLVAMIMLLVLAVLDTGSAATKQSELTSAGRDAEALENLPTQIVITQLQRATTQTITDEGERLRWTSQPGMIRVFGTQPEKGKDRPSARMHYRLYSAPVMNSVTLDAAAEVEALSDWTSEPCVFTDINAPAMSLRNGKPHHVYPIADPAALGRVDGFEMRDPGPGSNLNGTLPMPVAWMYVTQDGRIVMPTSVDGTHASFPSNIVNKSNPIKGRIAFWTDDETCKLNLNTASEASPWDLPAADTQAERNRAANPPLVSESHKSSAHPAFTSLSPVLKTFGQASLLSPQWPKPDVIDPKSTSATDWRNYQKVYQALVPHGLTETANPKDERHFATVDEFFYNPQRQTNGASDGFLMNREDLNISRFFLTTRSNSPELNPFGGPKLPLWMVPKDPQRRILTDQQIVQCTTLNDHTDKKREFVFQRASYWTSTDQPGSSQSASDDWNLVPRNQELYKWLQSMTGMAIPGVGGRFTDKYGFHSRDQILTSMLDMLRWGSNTASYLPPSFGSRNPRGLAEQCAVPLAIGEGDAATRGFGRFPTVTEVAVVFAFTDVERDSSGNPKDANGDGICDRATKLRAFIVLNPFLPACGPPSTSPAWSFAIRRLMKWTIGPGTSLQLPGGNVRNRCTLSGSQPVNVGGSSAHGWGGGTTAHACFASQFLQADGTPKELGERDDPARGFPFVSMADVTLQNAADGRPGTKLKFSGGQIMVDLMDANSGLVQPTDADAIHSVEVEFPSKDLTMPSLKVSDFQNGPRLLDNRFKPVLEGDEVRLHLIQPGDIVRSIILDPKGRSQGDVRLLAAHRQLKITGDDDVKNAAAWFTVHPDCNSKTLTIAQSLRDGAYQATGQYGAPNLQPTGKTAGSLLKQVQYAAEAVPCVPVGLEAAQQIKVGSDPGGRIGDWETGLGQLEDGPYVSRSCLSPAACFDFRPQLYPPGQAPALPPLCQMPSAFCFGGIPSGVFGDSKSEIPRPWQTLLFCPNPAGRTTSASSPGSYNGAAHDHFGFASPPDHLWLEFFAMPITTPWPMTSRFATEGKVNLNHQIMPFTWMRRATALHGALKGVRITASPTAALTSPSSPAKNNAAECTFRYEVDANKTVQGMDAVFDSGDVFRYPSEI